MLSLQTNCYLWKLEIALKTQNSLKKMLNVLHVLFNTLMSILKTSDISSISIAASTCSSLSLAASTCSSISMAASRSGARPEPVSSRPGSSACSGGCTSRDTSCWYTVLQVVNQSINQSIIKSIHKSINWYESICQSMRFDQFINRYKSINQCFNYYSINLHVNWYQVYEYTENTKWNPKQQF